MSGFLPTDLIKEVKIRPGIYNKEELIPPRRQHRQQLWLEVAESLTPPEEWDGYTEAEKEMRVGEVSNKWKNLRDHFYREIKLIEAGLANKKRKYIYYNEMEFVRPYIGYKQPPLKKRGKKSFGSSNAQESQDNDTDFDMDDFLKSPEKSVNSERKFTPHSRVKLVPGAKQTVRAKQHKVSSSTPMVNRSQKDVIIKNFDVIKKTDATRNPTFKIRESDVSFCLSLVPTLRQMSDVRKLSAKIDILKVLRKNVSGRVHNNTKKREPESEDTEDDFEGFDIKDDPLNNADSM